MHYYPHHIGDFIKDTSRLSDSQCMAYLRLIWMYYESESPLPDDPKMLAFKIGSDEQTVAMLLQCYFYANALHWHHTRIDLVLDEYKNKSKKASDSAKARWNNAKAMRTHSECNAKPITNNQEPININDTQAKPAKSPEMTFDKFVESRESQGLTAIIESDPVWAVIDSLGMPDDFAVLQWRYIESQYSAKKGGKAKRYAKWPTVLAKALRELWGQLFFKHETQGWILTSKGKNLKELAA